jgi:glycerol uptake facilitator-like aquaporin
MNKYLVEFLGTAFLVFVILATGNWLAIGSALAIGIFLGGPISDGAYNPAVVIALYVSGKLPKHEVFGYILVEILGGLMAFFIYDNYVKNK